MPTRKRRLFRSVTLTTWTVGMGLATVPGPVSGQLGVIEAFARRVTDLSFNAQIGGLAPQSSEVSAHSAGIRSYGVELLFAIRTVSDSIGPGPAVRDSASITWTQMIVNVGPDGVDTTYTYEVHESTPPGPRMRTIWTFEMGLGYSQLVGFDAADPRFDLRGQVRDLPALTLYATYDPLGFYFGLRSGFMTLQGLQVYNAAGDVFAGKSDSFLLAGVLGSSTEVMGITVFLEGAYSIRHFPSVEWRGLQAGVPLDPGLPRNLSFTSWTIGTGVQFGLGS